MCASSQFNISYFKQSSRLQLTYFLFRRSSDSPDEQHTHTYEEADNSISAETEAPVVESWKTLNQQSAVDQVLKTVASLFDVIQCSWPNYIATHTQHFLQYLSRQCWCFGHFVLYWYQTRGPRCSNRLVHYLSQQKGKLISVIVRGATRHPFCFWNVLFSFIRHSPVLVPHPAPLLRATFSFYHMNSYFGLSYRIYIKWVQFQHFLLEFSLG